jgi:hypothetical protein
MPSAPLAFAQELAEELPQEQVRPRSARRSPRWNVPPGLLVMLAAASLVVSIGIELRRLADRQVAPAESSMAASSTPSLPSAAEAVPALRVPAAPVAVAAQPEPAARVDAAGPQSLPPATQVTPIASQARAAVRAPGPTAPRAALRAKRDVRASSAGHAATPAKAPATHDAPSDPSDDESALAILGRAQLERTF